MFTGRCPGEAFACQNGQCVAPGNVQCDGRKNCSDGSDEAECGGSLAAGAAGLTASAKLGILRADLPRRMGRLWVPPYMES